MKRVALACALALALLAGCAGEPRERVVLWHHYGGDERAALEAVAREAAHELGIAIELVAVPYENFADKITNAVPNGNGPDLFIFAHDRLGDWVEAGLVEPLEFYIDEALAERYAYDALASMAYRTSLYGLPLAVKSVALFYRTDLVSEPPRTTDELLAFGRARAGNGSFRYALAYDPTDLYGHAAWLHGFGGVIFEGDELAVASNAAVAAASFVRGLVQEGLVPRSIRGEMIATLFSEGQAAMAISGPWFIADIADGTPWAITSLPVVSETGEPAAPFLGTEGLLMSSRSLHKPEAFSVMRELAGDRSAALRAREARQVVPNVAAYQEPDIGDDPVLGAFRRQLEHTVPMPATPEMRMVWTPYARALELAIGRGGDAARALADAEQTIRGYIQGAQRP
jgi:arabinogalactan oligomer / maltooligosaccharide transport system substrate-binding protein